MQITGHPQQCNTCTWDDKINEPRKDTLTLCDGKDQIPLLQEFPVQPWGSEEEMRDRCQTGPVYRWLDVLLQIRVGDINNYS